MRAAPNGPVAVVVGVAAAVGRKFVTCSSLPRPLVRTPFRSLCSCRDLRSLLLLLLRLPAAAVVNSPTLHSGPDPIALRMWQRLPNGGDHEMLETNEYTHKHLGKSLFLNSDTWHSVAAAAFVLQVGDRWQKSRRTRWLSSKIE